MPKTETGTVKFFSRPQGYGMIEPKNGGPDVFFHVDHCRFPASLLRPRADAVLFQREPEQRPEGWRAEAVWLVKSPDTCPCCGGKMRTA